jgi:hypothetical protein
MQSVRQDAFCRDAADLPLELAMEANQKVDDLAVMGFTVVESDGTTYDLILQSSDYYSRPTVVPAGNFFLLDVTHGAKNYASFRGITPSRLHDSRIAVSR